VSSPANTVTDAGSLLDVRDLTMRFDAFTALDSVTLTIAEGSATAIVGPNGAGKTTLLNCMCGMYRPSQGEIRLRGERIDGLRPHQIVARGVGRTFQSVEQFRIMTVLDLALLGRHQAFQTHLAEEAVGTASSGAAERRNREEVIEILRELDIVQYMDSRLESLPYGVRKLADVARALAGNPEVVLLDEPTAGMGPGEKQMLLDVFRRLRGRLFKTAVIIDHDVQFVKDLCELSIVLDFGKMIASGPTATVFTDRLVVEAYLGLPGPVR
jgi:branched-chain amino acid transport system ATP-binding protein